MASFKLFGVDIIVHDPTPLQQYRPPNEKPKKKKKKREHGESSSRGGGKRRRIEEPDRSIPEQLLEKVESTEPVFLYQRKLSPSDVKEGQSRLFVLKKEGFQTMLTEGEWGIVAGKGLKNVVSVDTGGRLYKLGLRIWPSLDMLVINSKWSKLVKQNAAKEGDWVQIWGHRDQMGANLRMAINFIKA